MPAPGARRQRHFWAKCALCEQTVSPNLVGALQILARSRLMRCRVEEDRRRHRQSTGYSEWRRRMDISIGGKWRAKVSNTLTWGKQPSPILRTKHAIVIASFHTPAAFFFCFGQEDCRLCERTRCGQTFQSPDYKCFCVHRSLAAEMLSGVFRKGQRRCVFLGGWRLSRSPAMPLFACLPPA